MSPQPSRNQRLKRLHERTFNVPPACIAFAPGRLMILGDGEYSDDGLSMACAIGRYTWVAASPREDRRLVAHSEWARQTIRISPRPPTPTGHGFWGDHIVGVWSGLTAGRVQNRGVSLTIAGDLPPGIGLGSSASLQMAVAFVMRELWDLSLDNRDLAMVAHRSENLFVGVNSGLVDQMVAVSGRTNKILCLDCNTFETDQMEIPSHIDLVVCDSGVHRALARAPFNERRGELDEGLHFFKNRYPGLTGFRQVSAEMLVQGAEELSPTVLKRVRHVVTENDRVRRAAIALRWGDIETLGGIMLASYRSLKDAFDSSTPELDEIIHLSGGIHGVIGSRPSGPGFGGCTIHLVEHKHAAALVKRLRRGYKTPAMRTPQVFTLSPVSGAAVACFS